MGSDACFRMGSTHQICQDYAIAGAHHGFDKDVLYAILSDGCSGVHTPGEPGSPFTDFGSRFLVRAANQFLKVNCRSVREYGASAEVLEHFGEISIVGDAYNMALHAHFDRRALDGTLIRAVQLPSGEVIVHQAGDGVVAARNRDTGLIRYHTTKFGNNMPYYLSYLLDLNERDRYFSMAKTVEVVHARQTEDGWKEHSLELPLNRETKTAQEFRFTPENDLVLIMSDGAESFQDREGQPVPVEKIVEQLFDVKSFEGEFLVRRCNRFLTKFCAERGWKHNDDFSVAGIYIKATP